MSEKEHRKPFIACALAVGLILTGCSTRSTGVSYEQAVQRVEATLDSRVDHGIFPYQKIPGDEGTEFQFVVGSRQEKADHAFPLRVTVTIKPEGGGADSSYAVDAFKHGLKLKTRDQSAEDQWRAEIEQSFTNGEPAR